MNKPTLEYQDSKKQRIIVVGAGGSGLSAAIAALQAKPDIDLIVLEKHEVYGGITQISTGTIRACDTRLQKEIGRKGVTKQDAFKEYLETGGYAQDKEILSIFLDKSKDAIDWLISLGCKIELLNDYRHMIAPSREGVPGGTGMTDTLYQNALKLGATFLFETGATELIKKNGKICGVKATAKDGKELQFDADAVILADGGFWAAPSGSFDNDIPSHLKDVIIAAEGCYPQGGTGDGAAMAQSVGASLQNMDKLEYTVQRYLDGEGNLCPIIGSATIWSEAACIILNQDLQRFLNEDLCYAKETLSDEVAKELTKRHEKWFWNICDEISRENTYRIRYWISLGWMDQGFILTGNTVEELAKEMGVDSAKLKAAIAKYNSYFEQGLEKDPEFGRNLKREKVHPFITPPFYAIRAGIQCTNRRGGISIDAETHALDHNKKPIPGLYVAGSSMFMRSKPQAFGAR